MSTPRVALVLGGGGVVGHAWHVGALAALEEATGWDPRRAELIVGTSAGAMIGALLRTGLSAGDLHARATGGTVSDDGRRLLGRLEDGPENWPFRPDTPRRLPGLTPAAAGLLPRLLTPPIAPVGVIGAALAPAGRSSATAVLGDHIGPLVGDGWPDQPLWLVAVSLDDGRRAVFGRTHLDVPLHRAIAASCAIPAVFAPVDVDGERMVDGGAWSVTNLDLVADLGFDLVVVSSPMSVAGRPRLAADWPLRRAATTALHRETGRIRRAGTEVLVVEPAAADTEVMGADATDRSRVGAVAARAFDSTASTVNDRGLVPLVEMLRSAVTA